MKSARILTAMVIVGTSSLAAGHTDAATITASYVVGHSDVLINGYGTRAMGSFRLDDGGEERLALCIEAHEAHSTGEDAYRPVDSRVDSAELDMLLWLTERDADLTPDRAVAAAALAWFYAGARRSIGPPVWADGSSGFAPIAPLSPEPWDQLRPLSLDHPIGLRSGHIDLDGAERDVAALHRRVMAMRGPWRLNADDHRFRLMGPDGPIAGQPVAITAVAPDGRTRQETEVTDVSGWVEPELTGLVDGAVVSAQADAPGPHREWDGDGAIQRMATATTQVVDATFDLPPLPRHVQVVKRSTDPTIGVAGGVFVLFDANGDEIATATSDDTGIARFPAFEPTRHAGPYVVHERSAPPGLDRTASDVEVSAPSFDPDNPTTVEMVDAPLLGDVRVRKRLSDEAVGPADRSGFVFSIRRRADSWADEAVTGPDGITDSIRLPVGVYDICERSTPTWAAGLVDYGCVELVVDAGVVGSANRVVVDYLNTVPTPTIETVATSADGTSHVSGAGGEVVDTVYLTGLVPGTAYTVAGEIVDRASATSTGVTATARFVAERLDATVRVEFVTPALPAGAIVVIEQLLVGDRVVAEHADLDDADQTVLVVPPTTTTTSTTMPTSGSTTTTSTIPTTTPTTTTSTITATTTTTATATNTTTTTAGAPATSITRVPPPTLPRTGGIDAGTVLRLGDIGFVLGVLAIAIVGVVPHRDEEPEAGV